MDEWCTRVKYVLCGLVACSCSCSCLRGGARAGGGGSSQRLRSRRPNSLSMSVSVGEHIGCWSTDKTNVYVRVGTFSTRVQLVTCLYCCPLPFLRVLRSLA